MAGWLTMSRMSGRASGSICSRARMSSRLSALKCDSTTMFFCSNSTRISSRLVALKGGLPA